MKKVIVFLVFFAFFGISSKNALASTEAIGFLTTDGIHTVHHVFTFDPSEVSSNSGGPTIASRGHMNVSNFDSAQVRAYGPVAEYWCYNAELTDCAEWGDGDIVPCSGGGCYLGAPNEIYLASLDVFNSADTAVIFADNSSWGAAATPLSFPLSGYTAYTAEVSSVMDHSMTTPYTKDGTVLAFNGEEGNVDNGCWCYSTNSACNSSNYTSCTVAGFMKEGSGNFLVGIINYNDTYLYYDGHPGYDYPMTSGTYIYAPANGTLCVATSVTQQPQPSDVWRDTGHCPLSTAGSTTWSGYHTFYIIHEGLYINGSTNDYMTVFLHSNDLESTVRANVEQYGYDQVTKNQHVANVGSVGSGANHMHIEVYKKNGENWDRVDPYGDGTSNILWEQN